MIDEEQLSPASAHIVTTSATTPALVKRAPQAQTAKAAQAPTTPAFNPFGSSADAR